ncbi:hypothetical protein BDP55DRAFT_155571 [Colletotrichum godetiae]|uniref:Uncharacterized protein n=1 Tax=Colletotrichum godetiae TaxID=1209918 RepID=A0AAJ0EVN0_9PEZI|nr:uncharacterized protein BDP55DRAFT_155571 [Colletotrichum godetiae]KAK1675473.1 hypothetical protein BDP55DRAFT_155571 [Colletotrichum godetiae]
MRLALVESGSTLGSGFTSHDRNRYKELNTFWNRKNLLFFYLLKSHIYPMISMVLPVRNTPTELNHPKCMTSSNTRTSMEAPCNVWSELSITCIGIRRNINIMSTTTRTST